MQTTITQASKPTLREKIEAANVEFNKAKQLAYLAHLQIIDLENKRKDCVHSFSAPITGYDHEGGYCTHCGINEVYARSWKIGKQYT